MKTTLLTLSLVESLWICLIFGLGIFWYILKIPNSSKKVKNNTIDLNIQSINKMGYRPEEDDEITGYELAEKPYIEKSGGYINEHLNFVINEK